MAGITPEGFERPTLRDLLDAIELDEHNTISPLLDVSADQPIGQLNGLFAERLSILWELAEILYHSFDPDAAEGDLLENLTKIVGVTRRPASKSQVPIQCELEPDVELLAGVHFVSHEDHPDRRFTPRTNFTATEATTQTYTVGFECEVTGPVAADAHKLTVIATAVTGWLSADNDEPADLGREVDDDPTLRQRREDALARAGGSTVDAIRADLLALADSRDDVPLATVRVLENDTDDFADGTPPHAFEIVIFDSSNGSNTELNNAVAQVIWDNKPVGIRSVGTSSGIATDVDGQTHAVPFTRPTARDIHIAYTLETNADYPGDGEAAELIATKCQELFPPGTDVIASHVRSIPFILNIGVTDVTAFSLGFAASPTADDNLEITFREFAQFTGGNVELTT